MTSNVVDSCGWLEYFIDGENADFFAAAVEDTGSLVVPSVCIAEIFKIIARERDENTALAAISAMNQGRIIDLNMVLALDAARLGLIHKLPLADSIVYATARAENAIVWTQDKHFQNIADVRFPDDETG